MATINRQFLDDLANDYADDYHRNHFSSRRGMCQLETDVEIPPTHAVLYDNNPWKLLNGRCEFRDVSEAMIIERLQHVGIRCVARGKSTAENPAESGYTTTMIFECPDDRYWEVCNIVQGVINERGCP